MRHALSLSPVSQVAHQPNVIELARTVLGPAAFPFRATLFDKSPHSKVEVEWSQRPERVPFGHRLDFLSPEVQHLNTGKLKIMPPLNPEKRKRGNSS